MSTLIAVAADLLVAVLLAATIVTSLRLSGRIRGFKADEATLRGMISELSAATDGAERAIAGLRITLAECERMLGEHLRQATTVDAELEGRIRAGQGLLDRIGSIADLSRRAVAETGRVAPEPPDRAESLKLTGQALDSLVRRFASRPPQDRAA